MACFGQNKDALKDISSVTFYGIDFTRAKVYGAKEGPMQFKYTFDDINKLFITEPKKYDIGKRLGVNVEVTSLEAVNDANKTINPDEIMTTNSGYTLDEKQIEEVIKTLPILSQEEKNRIDYDCHAFKTRQMQERPIKLYSSTRKPVRYCIVHRLTAKHAVSDYAIIGQVPYTAP